MERTYLAVPNIEPAATPYAWAHARNRRNVEWVIGALGCHHPRGDGHPRRIKDAEHDLDLRPIWAMVLAVPQREQAVRRKLPAAGRAGLIRQLYQ